MTLKRTLNMTLSRVIEIIEAEIPMNNELKILLKESNNTYSIVTNSFSLRQTNSN